MTDEPDHYLDYLLGVYWKGPTYRPVLEQYLPSSTGDTLQLLRAIGYHRIASFHYGADPMYLSMCDRTYDILRTVDWDNVVIPGDEDDARYIMWHASIVYATSNMTVPQQVRQWRTGNTNIVWKDEPW